MEEKAALEEASYSSRISASPEPLLPLTTRGKTTSDKKTNSLAFLDGLRGIAALIVYSHHHITEYYGINCDLMHASGFEGRHRFGQLRFIQLFFAGGTPAVMIFFVLSGYVLSRSAFSMIESGKSNDSILKYLLNALLRRPVRLWLPPILVSIPIVIAFHTPFRPVGAYTSLEPNIFLEFRTWFVTLIDTINPMIGHGPFLQSFHYNPPVWTMAYELSGSVVVYAMMAGAIYLTQRNRMIALFITLPLVFEYGHFSLLPFVLGMILAQVDVASLDKPYLGKLTEQQKAMLLNGIFVVGWYLLSDVGPLVKPEKPWFGLSADWIPFFFYHNTNLMTNIIGAFFMVYAALRLPWLQTIFNRAAWLGRVSFALYLTHVPIMWFLAVRVKRAFEPVQPVGDRAFFDGWLPLPDVGPQGLTTRYLAMQLIVLPLNLALAELVTVWVDEYSVVLSKQFAARVMQRLHL